MNLEYYKDLILVLTQKELKVRYKSSFLGYLWSILNPLFYTLIYFLAFKIVMRISIEDYTLFLICGLFPWQWLANSVSMAPMLFLSNASLIKKTNFPRETVILADVFQNMIHFIIAIPVIIVVLFIYDKIPSWSWFYGIPVLLLIQFLITYALTLAISSLNLFFRDLERITALFITLAFFTTPIFYSETMIPEEYHWLLYINPLSGLMVSWRNLFMTGGFEIRFVLRSLIAGVVVFLIGYFIYRKLRWRFAEVL